MFEIGFVEGANEAWSVFALFPFARVPFDMS